MTPEELKLHQQQEIEAEATLEQVRLFLSPLISGPARHKVDMIFRLLDSQLEVDGGEGTLRAHYKGEATLYLKEVKELRRRMDAALSEIRTLRHNIEAWKKMYHDLTERKT